MTMDEELQERQFEELYEDYALQELAKEMVARDEAHKALKAQAAEIYAAYEYLRKVAIPRKMEEMGIEMVRLDGIGTVSLRTDAYCTVPAQYREELHDWLRYNGHADLVTSTVNASTLKAFIKEQMMEGQEVPDMVKFEPYTYATITGGRNGKK